MMTLKVYEIDINILLQKIKIVLKHNMRKYR